jgi:alkylated DNA repair dioxygenase AlkB
VKYLDEQTWEEDLKRRVLQFGYRFNHQSQNLELSRRVDPIPLTLQPIIQRLMEGNHFSQLPDQIIVNEYLPGQGIFPHIDKTHCFQDEVCTISFLSSIVMDFRHTKTFQQAEVFLERRSLLCLKESARYEWTHGIAQRIADNIMGREIARRRRISVTMRTVILPQK